MYRSHSPSRVLFLASVSCLTSSRLLVPVWRLQSHCTTKCQALDTILSLHAHLAHDCPVCAIAKPFDDCRLREELRPIRQQRQLSQLCDSDVLPPRDSDMMMIIAFSEAWRSLLSIIYSHSVPRHWGGHLIYSENCDRAFFLGHGSNRHHLRRKEGLSDSSMSLRCSWTGCSNHQFITSASSSSLHQRSQHYSGDVSATSRISTAAYGGIRCPLLTQNSSLFDRRIIVSSYIESRSATDTVRWCAHNSQVYLLLTQSGAIEMPQIAAILASAWVSVHTHLAAAGDGPLPGGEFFVQFNNLGMRVWNVNNHQTTWGVLNVAILALKDLLSVKKGLGAVIFKIFDGNNEVGQGQIYYTT